MNTRHIKHTKKNSLMKKNERETEIFHLIILHDDLPSHIGLLPITPTPNDHIDLTITGVKNEKKNM